jgi:long-chain acyl-CoA synthetase
MRDEFRSLLDAVRYFATATPGKIALIEGESGREISYADFWTKIKSAAEYIADGGLKKNYRVVLRTSQTINYLSAYYGVQLAGGVSIPLDKSTKDEQLDELAEFFEASFIWDFKNDSEGTLCKYYATQEIGEAQGSSAIDPADPSVILYTTGTTGKNKGVISSYYSRFCGADNVRYSYEITSEDIALVPQIMSHSGGLRRVEAMLVSGATAIIMNASMFYGSIFKVLEKYNVTVFQLVPAQVAAILNSAEKLLVRTNNILRIFSVGSAVIPEAHKEKLRELLPDVRLFNDFGSTEASGSAYFEWSKYPPKPDCVGEASLHSEIIFLDENGSVSENTSRENPGILATKGNTLMLGYYNEPELTAETLHDNMVVSSDIGYKDEEGLIYLVGRKADLINSGGYKISPLEIEDAANAIVGVLESAAFGKKDDIMEQVPALFVAMEKGFEFDGGKISFALAEKLDRHKVPKVENIIEIEKLPRSIGTGKVLRKELADLL